MTFRILALNGSLRDGSSNGGLLRLAERLAAEQFPGELQVERVGMIVDLPWYDPDLEVDPPASARAWRELLAGADGLWLGMPEYNFGPTALLKNAIDWASRPAGAMALSGKVIAMFTSGGKGGGSNVQQGLAPILGWFGNTVVAEPPVCIKLGAERIDGDGVTTDTEILDVVGAKVAAFVAALRDR